MPTSLRCFFAALTVLCFSAPAMGSIVVNGDFESPNIGNTLFQTFTSGSTAITGWTVNGTSVDLVTTRTGISGYAFSGQQSVDLSGTPGPGGIFQDLPTTAGLRYLVSFDVSTNDQGNPGVSHVNRPLVVKINGVTVLTLPVTPPQGTWLQFNVPFIATGPTTRLEFDSVDGANEGPLLDLVSADVAPVVPEPSTIAILGVGGLGLAFAAFRRRKNANKNAK